MVKSYDVSHPVSSKDTDRVQEIVNPEGGDMSGTYTEEDLTVAIEAAVAKALAPFQEEAALESLAIAFEDAKAPLVAEIDSLKAELDSVVLRANKAEADYTALVTLLEEAQAAADRAAEIAARREARREAVKELSFSEDYVEANLDRWAAKSDEDFAELLDGWEAVTSAKKEEAPAPAATESIPTTTAMKASRDDKNVDPMANVREIQRMGLRGINIRSL